ncbi:ABC exporter membrane fusion protein [Crocosphaera sp. XPORK-15E]|uniref:ABC exporter membrane fusion protein n=1 Tax=Crocosphaera sp. XPORK-15E TaxID=3110247 RepID=UPI002B1ED034|nr:ABC exporter membrane fusion protein [Crocosphaera sp. XPORK-15E]MEA5532426.1 ABC exporter membrane fusion protein [Crocosphaera sp. XPORK-15E]
MTQIKMQNQWLSPLIMVFFAIIGSSVITLAIVAQIRPSPSNQSINVNRLPTEKTRLKTVAALGRLEPQGEVIQISVPTVLEGAKVEQLFLKQGETVKKGQVIAILHNRDRLQAALDQTMSQVAIAQANLAKVNAGAKIGEIRAQKADIARIEAELQGQKASQQASINRIKAELNNAKTDCHRYQTLYQDGAISASEKDNICVKAETYQEQLIETQTNRDRTIATLAQQLAEAQATLEQIAEIRPVDVAIAQAELNKAKTEVKQAQANLDLAYVYAPQDGQILKIQTFAGEMVGQQGIVDLGQTQQMYAIAEVYETDIHQIRNGQTATISSQGFEGKLTGTVDEIGLQIGKKDSLGTDPAADVDARVVEVKIRLSPTSSQQVRGLTNLQVKIIINTQSLPAANS